MKYDDHGLVEKVLIIVVPERHLEILVIDSRSQLESPFVQHV